MHQTYFYKQQLTYSGLNDLADDISDNLLSHDHTEGAGGTGKKLTASGLENSASTEIRDYGTVNPFVVTGLQPATASGLTSSISAGKGFSPEVAAERLVQVTLESATSHTYNASKDTYVYLHPYIDMHGSDDGYFHFEEVPNDDSEPEQPDSTIKLAKVVTDGSDITSVVDLRDLSSVFNNSIKEEKITDNAVTSDKANLTSGQVGMSSTFTFSAANGVYQATNLKINLPAAGTYLIVANIRCTLKWSGGTWGWITTRLRNTTDSAYIANSHRISSLEDTPNISNQETASISMIVTVDGPKTIEVWSARNGASTWTAVTHTVNSNGTSTLGYVRIA